MGSFREEFMRTERSLAMHMAGIKERLVDSVTNGIGHLYGNESELAKMPAGLRREFLEFMDEMTKAGGSPYPNEGAVHGTVREMSEGEAQIMVDRFLALSYQVKQLRRGGNEDD